MTINCGSTFHSIYGRRLVNVPVVSGGLFLSIINIIDINNNECTASNNIIDMILKLREREREENIEK